MEAGARVLLPDNIGYHLAGSQANISDSGFKRDLDLLVKATVTQGPLRANVGTLAVRERNFLHEAAGDY